jgi:hypothetical protein
MDAASRSYTKTEKDFDNKGQWDDYQETVEDLSEPLVSQLLSAIPHLQLTWQSCVHLCSLQDRVQH